jgi:sulfoxide reductase heme-binding subunit YedZ
MKFLLFILLSLPFGFLLWDIFAGNLIDPIEETTNPTGQWAMRFLLLTLAITPFSKITKISLIKYRRMVGLASFFYALLHLSIFLIDQQFNLNYILEEITKRPYITIGFSAFILLLLLAITSNNFSIRKLKKHWKKLHQLVYLIVVLVIIHFYWQVKSWMDIEPLVYAIIAVFLLGYRFKKSNSF